MASESFEVFLFLAVIVLVALAFAFLIAFIVAVFFYFRSKKRPDSVDLLAKDHAEICKVNLNPNLRVLWLVPVPSMIDLLGLLSKIDFSKAGIKAEVDSLIKAVESLVSCYRSSAAIFKGEIIGSNVLDRQATLSELTESKANPDESVTLRVGDEEGITFSKEEIEVLTKEVNENGAHLNLFLYERDFGKRFLFFFPRKEWFIVCAYDKQILLPGMSRSIEVKEGAGDVLLLAPGTTRFGRFEFLTGYPHNSKLMSAELKCLTWTMVNRQLLANSGGIVEDALSLNVGFSQGATYRELDRPIKQDKGKD